MEGKLFLIRLGALFYLNLRACLPSNLFMVYPELAAMITRYTPNRSTIKGLFWNGFHH